MDEHDHRLWRNLGAAHYWAPGGREKAEPALRRAVELAREALEVTPDDADVLAQLADSHAMLGDETLARERVREALALAPGDVEVMRLAAGVFEHVGDREEALRWVGRALEAGYPARLIESNPWFQDLRSDPRYRASRDRFDAGSRDGGPAGR